MLVSCIIVTNSFCFSHTQCAIKKKKGNKWALEAEQLLYSHVFQALDIQPMRNQDEVSKPKAFIAYRRITKLRAV